MTIQVVNDTTYIVSSHTSKTTTYTVTLDPTAPIMQATCTCKGYGYRGHCSHIDDVARHLIAGYQAQAAQQPTPPTQTFTCGTCGAKLPATHAAHGICPSCVRRQTFEKDGYYD